jgi:hypothetical protein
VLTRTATPSPAAAISASIVSPSITRTTVARDLPASGLDHDGGACRIVDMASTAEQPSQPPEPSTPAKTTAQKLFIKPTDTLYLGGGHQGLHALLDPLPEGITLTHRIGEATAVVLFAQDQRSLDGMLDDWLDAALGARVLWIGYPKGGRSDLNRDTIWKDLQGRGHRLNANIPLSEEWSSVRVKTGS